jgi:hypothetical protein
VVVVDRDMWGQEHYREMVTEALDLANADAHLSPEAAARLAGRPVMAIDNAQWADE